MIHAQESGLITIITTLLVAIKPSKKIRIIFQKPRGNLSIIVLKNSQTNE